MLNVTVEKDEYATHWRHYDPCNAGPGPIDRCLGCGGPESLDLIQALRRFMKMNSWTMMTGKEHGYKKVFVPSLDIQKHLTELVRGGRSRDQWRSRLEELLVLWLEDFFYRKEGSSTLLLRTLHRNSNDPFQSLSLAKRFMQEEEVLITDLFLVLHRFAGLHPDAYRSFEI